MQHRIGGTTRRRHRSDGILDGFARDDPRWSQVTAQKLDYELPGVESGFVLFRNRRWDTITPDRRDSQKLHDRRHRVGGELPTACARARASRVFDGFELFLINSAAAVGPHRLEDVLNRQVAIAEMPWSNGTAVERESRNIETLKRHHDPGIRLIATRKTAQRVTVRTPRHKLNGIRNHLATDERPVHPFGAHADSLGDGYSVELHGRSARRSDTFLNFGRQ